MNGNFDEVIRQQMHGSQRGLGMQDARDRAARQLNIAERGVNSTAYPQSSVAQTAAPAQVAAPVQGPAVPNELQAMIAAQVGEDGPPVPTAAPRGGDGTNTLQAELADRDVVRPGNIEQMIVQQMGDGTAAEQAGVRFPSQQTAQPLPHPVSPMPEQNAGGLSDNASAIMGVVMALGGAAGVRSLIQRYRMGDPNAARTFEAIGIHPDDFSMFASEAAGPAARSGVPSGTKQNDPGLQTVVPRTDITDPRATEALKRAYPIGALQMAPTVDADQAMEADQDRINKLHAAEGVEANQRPGGSNVGARNLPQSRPKAKPEAKPKSKAKIKPKVK